MFKMDVRCANIVGEMLAASAIAGVGWRRQRPWLGLAVAITFLNLPRTPWIIEQAWYEPMLAGLFGVGFWFSELSGWRRHVGGALIGLAVTAKQFGLPLLMPVAGSLRTHWRNLLMGLIISAVVILPFLVAAPREFVDTVVRKHFGRGLQPQSVTIASASAQWLNGVVPRPWVMWSIAAALILSVSWRRAGRPAVGALPTGTALLAFSVCHTQGFPNYFYLCNYLWLLGFVALVEPIPRSDTATEPDPKSPVEAK
jgi:hypothetical protein